MEFDTTVVIDNMDALLLGLQWTLMMVAGSLLLGTVLGLAACLAKLMAKGPLHWLALGCIELYRTLPEMVNLFWIFYCLPLILGIRMSSVTVGLIAQTLLAGAFLVEIFRAGINAVPDGQVEAAYACGIPRTWMSTGSVAAVMNLDSSQAKNNAALAISQASPMPPRRGMASSRSLFNSSGSRPVSIAIPVMPRASSSCRA